jgi:hypothetical protein
MNTPIDQHWAFGQVEGTLRLLNQKTMCFRFAFVCGETLQTGNRQVKMRRCAKCQYWSSFHTIETETQNLMSTNDLLQTAFECRQVQLSRKLDGSWQVIKGTARLQLI